MSNYKPTIGLEIHVELKTRTKMFCDCLNDPDEKTPNKNVCPVCLGHPGVLPTINKKAVEAVLKLGLVLNSEIPEFSKFDRKNYFYPDLPKGYQISQYDKPLVLGGSLNGVKLRRIHLEEDTARLVHSADGKSSLVDFNRSSMPLMELVTEPDIKSGKEAVDFAKELQLILRYLEISDADMEKGHMRVEVNISVSKNNTLGTKVEIKNLNSFREVKDATDAEIERQKNILKTGGMVIQETYGTAVVKNITGVTVGSQRSKEEAHDYRYFPEPDLPPLDLTSPQGVDLEKLKAEIKNQELPKAKRERFVKEYNLSADQAGTLIEDKEFAAYFEEAASKPVFSGIDKNRVFMLLYNYLTSDLKGIMNERKVGIKELKISSKDFAQLISLVAKEEISSRLAKDILKEMFLTGADVHQIIKEKELTQISDDTTVEKAVKEIIKENPKAIEDYKKGKQNAFQFLVGQTMAKLKGRGKPEKIKEILDKNL
jgi:aspartyl-tRNA(Asn)/glutamyl-tRNA(Gln) amidotransferase subunit B